MSASFPNTASGSLVPETFTWAETLNEFNVTHNEFTSKTQTHFGRVAVGAVVFNTEGKVLLVQRAAKDTFPNLWEIPGGMVDIKDKTILHGVVRELMEESGLRATHIRGLAGCEDLGKLRNGKSAVKYSFIVEVDGFDVKIDREEHQKFIWATEQDVKGSRCGDVQIDFTKESLCNLVLNTFRKCESGGWSQKEAEH
ncbi:hypothetical protein Daus18300_009542 [Diaporthe australafricana]|uniref:Nudix hydrolase domain-containing protein n=1 Tax=Diaporthe australafricana TaxID=127596 RepID=A0ABR3WDW8_9PEZI